MNDLEQELRELLETKARESRIAPPAPKRVLRRARRRQVGVALVTAVTVAAVVTGSIAGLSAIRGPTPGQRIVGAPAEPRTTTLPAGLTVTYPSNWLLVDPWTLAAQTAVSAGNSGSGSAAQAPRADAPGGLPALQLSNVDLGLRPVCETGSLPDDGAVLYIGYDLGAPHEPGLALPAWPAELSAGPGPCGHGYYARFTADGNPYVAFASFGQSASGADRQVVLEAFAGLRFVPVDVSNSGWDTPAYVVASGTAGGQPWNIEAHPRPGNVVLRFDTPTSPTFTGGAVSGFTSADQAGAANIAFALGDGPNSEVVIFGAVVKSAVRVTADRVEGRLVPMPPSFDLPFKVFLVDVPTPNMELLGGTVTGFDADGNQVAEGPFAVTTQRTPPAQACPPVYAAPSTASSRPLWDAAAVQSALRNALAAAKTYFTDCDSYEGLTPEALVSIEPSLTYNASPTAVEGEISIRDVTDTTVLLVAESSDGRVWCIADDVAADTTTYGTVDAKTVEECTGGWPP
ncbi:MAG: hypothetical protein HYU54_05860 [Actinobacteria bacterium]|nr:hypothetical protein [Actinomycetota bacterium]